MPRELPSGTPTRAAGYLKPASSWRPVRLGLAAGAALLLLIGTLFFSGRLGVASPGPLSTAHGPIDRRCAECHSAGHAVSDLRCERCHDPGGTHRFAQTSHVGRGAGTTAAAHAGERVACAACHTEHRGEPALATAVDDRACAACHEFSSLAAHPEFAASSVPKTTGVGLKFTHDRHIAEVSNEGRRCDACHELAADLSGFEPIDFDRHCARCHTKDGGVTGESDPFDGRLISLPPPGDPVTVAPIARTLVTVSRVPHRDAWALDNLVRLRMIADPEADRAERLALQTELAERRGREEMQPVSLLAQSDLERLRDSLTRDLSAPISAASPGEQDRKTLAELTGALVALSDAPGADASAPQQPALLKDAGGAESPEAVTARIEARKAELLSVLDAISARGNPDVAAKVPALRARVAAVAVAGAAADGADIGGALDTRLRQLDSLFQAVRTLPDQQAAQDVAAVAAIRDAARQQVTGGLPIEQFEQQRDNLLRVLDAVSRQHNPALDPRVAALRQRVLLLRPGETTAERRARTSELLERVNLELEFAKDADRAAPSAIASERERQALQARVASLTDRLARLNRPQSVPAASTSPGPDEALNAITSFAAPCLKCHVMDGARLAPVAAAERLFHDANFTHKPHVLQADCLSCHAAVKQSKLATDVVVPGVATCTTCHTASKAGDSCTTCHSYHPASARDLAELR